MYIRHDFYNKFRETKKHEQQLIPFTEQNTDQKLAHIKGDVL